MFDYNLSFWHKSLVGSLFCVTLSIDDVGDKVNHLFNPLKWHTIGVSVYMRYYFEFKNNNEPLHLVNDLVHAISRTQYITKM